MQVLIQSHDIERALLELMGTHHRYRWAVAWASTGFSAWDALLRNKERIQQVVIGTHFHQTHPGTISALHGWQGVRFVTDLSGVFHHKIYLFEQKDGAWSAVVGSANFTSSAFSANDESAILITHRDPGAASAKKQLDQAIESAWRKAAPKLTDGWIRWYTQMWSQKQERLRALANKFGHGLSKRRKPRTDDGGRPVGDVDALTMTWRDYVADVSRERRGEDLEGRLETLAGVRKIFRTEEDFAAMSYDDRRRVAGVSPASFHEEEGIDWWWFGHMGGSGYFRQSVKHRHRLIGAALAAIPLGGPVERPAYRAFVRQYAKLPNAGPGTASRLLAMKRPDVFVSINAKSSHRLKQWFGLHQTIDLDTYWDSVIARIQEAVWWNAPRPARGVECRIWDGRAAMLDAIFYSHR